MIKNRREYVDKDHKVMDAYYDLYERYGGKNTKSIKRQLRKLIDEDPDFFDTYLLLGRILEDEGEIQEAEMILDNAYQRVLKLLTDKNGDWPDVLEWGWLENRHIIRTVLNKAIALWENGELDNALDLFRKLLKTNPDDNAGVRTYILAIRMNMTFEGFEERFNIDGFYDGELFDWFDENYKNFLDEFDWWIKIMDEYE